MTGCSSGIGQSIVQRLKNPRSAAANVVATVRSDADSDRLKTDFPTIIVKRLDLLDEQSVEAFAAEMAVDFPAGIDVLVNNAGIAVAGPVEELTRDDWRRQYEVNLIGTIDLTARLIPAIRQRKGRIINVGSGACHLALPFVSAYASSKRSLEGYNAALRRELRPMGIQTVLIIPGQTATPIFDKSERETKARRETQANDSSTYYADALVRFESLMHNSESSRRSPLRVASAVIKAINAKRPRRRYYVGMDARAAAFLDKCCPEAIIDWAIAKKIYPGE